MYTYYCIKVVLENGNYGYYSGRNPSGNHYITTDINSSRFYDTGDDALVAYRQIFAGGGTFGGVRPRSYSIVSVQSKYEL